MAHNENESLFNDGEKNIGILLEGVFESVFKNRIPIEIQTNSEIKFKKSSTKKNQIILIADGNFINNQFLNGDALPTGFDKHTGSQYGNGEFMLNAIDYLLGNEKFIEIRSRNIKLRLLNKQKINSEKKYWQLVNLIAPVIIILLISIILVSIRKKKYQLI